MRSFRALLLGGGFLCQSDVFAISGIAGSICTPRKHDLHSRTSCAAFSVQPGLQHSETELAYSVTQSVADICLCIETRTGSQCLKIRNPAEEEYNYSLARATSRPNLEAACATICDLPTPQAPQMCRAPVR